MKRWIAFALFGIMLATAPAAAQTTAPPAATASNDGAFDTLSPGNQKIARALFDAQQRSGSTSTPLSLDDIAAMKQSGRGWGEVFRDMKAQGLVQEKNLGQVVSKSAKPETQVTTGSGRTHVTGGKGKSEESRPGRSWKGDDGDGAAGAAVGGGSHGNAYGRGAAGSGGQGRFGGNPGHGGGRGK